MARTAVGLFLHRSLVGDFIRKLETNGFARQDIRILGEALGMTEPGAMSIAHPDFEVDLIRELRSIGASEDNAGCYLEGRRRGAVIVFAAASDQRAEIAAQIVNHHNAVEIKKLKVTGPHLPMDRSSIHVSQSRCIHAVRTGPVAAVRACSFGSS